MSDIHLVGGVATTTVNTPSNTNSRNNKRQASESPTNFSPPTSKIRTAPADNMALTAENFVALLTDSTVVTALKNVFASVITDYLDNANTKIKLLETELAKCKEQKTEQANIINELQKENMVLRAVQEESEQYSRRNSVRLWTDKPEEPNENTDEIVLEHARKIGASINLDDICRSHRVGRPLRGKNRAIIVKFISYNKRKEFYKNRKNDNRVYISEDLTKQRSTLLYKARELRRRQKISQCWSADGRIFVRGLSDGDTKAGTKLIKSEDDFSEFI